MKEGRREKWALVGYPRTAASGCGMEKSPRVSVRSTHPHAPPRDFFPPSPPAEPQGTVTLRDPIWGPVLILVSEPGAVEGLNSGHLPVAEEIQFLGARMFLKQPSSL